MYEEYAYDYKVLSDLSFCLKFWFSATYFCWNRTFFTYFQKQFLKSWKFDNLFPRVWGVHIWLCLFFEVLVFWHKFDLKLYFTPNNLKYSMVHKMQNHKDSKKDNSTRGSQAVTHPSTNRAQCCLTSVIGRELVFSTWYGRCQEVTRPFPLYIVESPAVRQGLGWNPLRSENALVILAYFTQKRALQAQNSECKWHVFRSGHILLLE